MNWPGSAKLSLRIQALLMQGKAYGAQSIRFDGPPDGIAIGDLDRWNGRALRAAIYVHERATGRVHRVVIARAQEEDFTVEVRNEIVTMTVGENRAVVLFDAPATGPEVGQIHFGVVVWRDRHGSQREPIAIFKSPRA